MKSNNYYSDLKLFYHMEKVKEVFAGRRIAPIYIRIKPTNICNQSCSYCVYANDKVFSERKVDRREFIPWEKMQEIINDISQMGVQAVTLSGGGEPLCYPYIIPTLKMLNEKGIQLSMITNAQALTGQVAQELISAKWLRVSLDSADDKTYEKLRGVTTFTRVLGNIEQFAKIKDKICSLGINFVVTKDNYQQIYKICEMLKNIGVNNIKFSPVMDGGEKGYHDGIRSTVEELLEKAKGDFEDEEFSIIDKYSNDLLLDPNFEKMYDKCFIKYLFTVIAADQKVYFCHQRAYMPEGLIGDISNTSFKELWFSEKTTERLDKHCAKTDCAFRCAFEERNLLLNQLYNLDENHVNFI